MLLAETIGVISENLSAKDRMSPCEILRSQRLPQTILAMAIAPS